MSISLIRSIQPLLMVACLMGVSATIYAQNDCYFTDEKISEIKFHYDLDRYMVGGCVIGAVFGSVTGLLSMTGITIVAAVPYIATGCSAGFLIGGVSAMVNSFFIPEPNSVLRPSQQQRH